MRLPASTATPLLSEKSPPFSVGFDVREGGNLEPHAISIAVPWLAGDATEEIFAQPRFVGVSHGFKLFEHGDLLLGCSTQQIDGNPAAATKELYRRLFAVTGERSLYRVWNYVPEINLEVDGLENYRAFCSGRAEAFSSALGAGFKPKLPSASAVGCAGDQLSVVFVGGISTPQHFENPQQIAAYNYPREHGPHSPSFSRATLAMNRGKPLAFISGTAAIKGHHTVAPGSLNEQIDCTFDNLRLIAKTIGIGENLGRNGAWQRHFKIYLRHAADLQEVSTRFEMQLAKPSDRVIYLEADICRAQLNVEIEATLVGL